MNKPRWISFVSIAAALSGCVGTIPAQEVKVPIPVSCVITIPSKPEPELDKLPLDAPVFDSVKALILDRSRLTWYSAQLAALLEACK